MTTTAGDPGLEAAPAAATTSAPAGQHGAEPRGADPADEGHPARWWILAVLAAVAFMAQLDLFIVNIALPVIGRQFGAVSLAGPSWVLNAYAVVFAALLVPAGRLADHFGRRRFLLAGVAVFTVASAACAVAPGLGELVAARAVQAIGAAMIVPTSLGLLYPAFSRRQHAMVVGFWAAVAAVAGTAGPPVGGLLAGLDWRWIFLINVPIGVFTLLLGWRVLPEVRAQPGSRLPDGASAAALLAAVTLLVLATVQGPAWGWSDPRTLGLLAAAVAAAGLTVTRTLRHPHALIEKALFRSRDFTLASVALFLFYIGFALFLLTSVLFLQGQWHYSPVRAGLAIMPGPVMSATVAVNAGRISARLGRTAPATIGTLLMAAMAAYWIIAAPAHPAYLTGFLPGLLIGGVSAGLTQAPLFAAAATLPPDRATTGSAVLNMSRQVGSTTGPGAGRPGTARWPAQETGGGRPSVLAASEWSQEQISQACRNADRANSSPAWCGSGAVRTASQSRMYSPTPSSQRAAGGLRVIWAKPGGAGWA
jgi:EmrB/QacA subfamily drug resistance transporter